LDAIAMMPHVVGYIVRSVLVLPLLVSVWKVGNTNRSEL